MSKKQQVIFRLDSNKYQQLKQKLDHSNFSINQLFESLSELVLNDTIKITAFGIGLAGDSVVNLDNSLSKEIDTLKKQLSDLSQVLLINYQNDSSKAESTVIKEIQKQIQQLEVRDAIAKDENQITEILPSEDALREEIEEVKDESYLMDVEQSEKPKMPVTDDLFLKCLEEVVKKMVHADIKDIHKATATLLNQRDILTKSKKGDWTWTKVRDYFGNPSEVTKYIDQYRKE